MNETEIGWQKEKWNWLKKEREIGQKKEKNWLKKKRKNWFKKAVVIGTFEKRKWGGTEKSVGS